MKSPAAMTRYPIGSSPVGGMWITQMPLATIYNPSIQLITFKIASIRSPDPVHEDASKNS